MTIGTHQITVDFWKLPQNIGEYFHLQGKVEQIVLQTILAKTAGTILCVGIDASLGRVAIIGRIQSFCNLRMWEANYRSLVEVVQNLRIESIAIHRHRFEISLIQ